MNHSFDAANDHVAEFRGVEISQEVANVQRSP
jgi:hypothetical protein